MVCRYSEEFNTYLRKNYGLGDDVLEFFTVHMVADKEHTARSADLIARYIKSPRDERLVRENAQHTVRIKLGKFEGIIWLTVSLKGVGKNTVRWVFTFTN